MHKHRYSETCIVHSGQVVATIDGKAVVAGAGDIVAIKPQRPHCFTIERLSDGPEALSSSNVPFWPPQQVLTG